MTEDDTVKSMRRIPFPDMLRKYNALPDITWNRMSDEEADKFFTDNGWTELEFRHKRMEHQ